MHFSTVRTKMSCLFSNRAMKGSEFIKKVKRLAKANNLSARVDSKRGKGSHVTQYYGDKFTIV